MTKPRLGASAVITDDDRILLVLRGRPPFEGRWSLPGGGVVHGEKLEATVRREVREETGLRVRVLDQVAIHEQIGPDDLHAVIVVMRAQITGGRLQAGDDAADVRWFTRPQVAKLRTTPRLKKVISQALGWRPAGRE